MHFVHLFDILTQCVFVVWQESVRGLVFYFESKLARCSPDSLCNYTNGFRKAIFKHRLEAEELQSHVNNQILMIVALLLTETKHYKADQ